MELTSTEINPKTDKVVFLISTLGTDQFNPQSEGPPISSSSLPVSNSSVPVSSSPVGANKPVMEIPRGSAPPKCHACVGCLLKEPCQECSMCLKGSTDCLRRRCKEKMRFYNEQQRLRKELAKKQLDSDLSDSSPGNDPFSFAKRKVPGQSPNPNVNIIQRQ